MATAFFEKSFVVKNRDSITQIKEELANLIKISVKRRDYKADKKKGITLLKQQLSASET